MSPFLLVALLAQAEMTPTPAPTATKTASPTKTATATPNMAIWIAAQGIVMRPSGCSIHWLYVNDGLKEPGRLGVVYGEGTTARDRLPGETDSALLIRVKAAVKTEVFAQKASWDPPTINGGGTIQ